ncbi:MAG TPA: hypothetical protein VGA38_02740 [Candidatus Limnocylindria bacterium]
MIRTTALHKLPRWSLPRPVIVVGTALLFVALAAIFGPAIGPSANPNATIQRAQHRSELIVFLGQSATSVTLAPGETATLTGQWQIDDLPVYVTRTVTTAAHGSYFVELRPSVNGVELLDVPPARFVVNAP